MYFNPWSVATGAYPALHAPPSSLSLIARSRES